jgi:hypothetical protein
MLSLKRLALCTIVSFAAACGGPMSDESTDSADAKPQPAAVYEPFDHYAAVKKLAAKYATNPVAVTLHGTPAKGVTKLTDAGSYTWMWTLAGNDAMFVDISAGPNGNKVLAHERRYFFAGQGTFDPTKLAVNGNDAFQLAKQAGLAAPKDMQLTASLTQAPAAHWSLDCGTKSASVDAMTGNLVKH